MTEMTSETFTITLRHVHQNRGDPATDDFQLSLPPSTASGFTIKDLKLRIERDHPRHPTPENLQLIYAGRILKNDEALPQALFLTAGELQGQSIVLHMVISNKNVASPSPSPARTPAPQPAAASTSSAPAPVAAATPATAPTPPVAPTPTAGSDPAPPRPAAPPLTNPAPPTSAPSVLSALEHSLGPALAADPRARLFYQQMVGNLAYSTALSAIMADSYSTLSQRTAAQQAHTQQAFTLPLMPPSITGVPEIDAYLHRQLALGQQGGRRRTGRRNANGNGNAHPVAGDAAAAAAGPNNNNNNAAAAGQGQRGRVRVFRIRLNLTVLWRVFLAALLLWGQLENPQRAAMVLAAIAVFQILNTRWLAPLRDRALGAMGQTGHWLRDIQAMVVAFLASLVPGWPIDQEERAAQDAARVAEDAIIRQIEEQLEGEENAAVDAALNAENAAANQNANGNENGNVGGGDVLPILDEFWSDEEEDEEEAEALGNNQAAAAAAAAAGPVPVAVGGGHQHEE